MYANDQELSAFKVLLINENLEEAKRILTRKLDVFRNEIRTASDLILQNLPRDYFATCLIPADVNQVKGERLSAIKATANGDCLFNSSSILLHGNESLAILLRLLVAGELYFKAQFYCDHDAFSTNGINSDITLETLFSVALTDEAMNKFSETGSKVVASTRYKWSSFVHLLGLASLLSQPVHSVYPDVNFRYRMLMHRGLHPRTPPTSYQPPENVVWKF